ncbi:MAG: cobalt-zinc-cadmium efflux system membrane fusion protein [Hyphomicrobiaceae bacterium]|jgi:cobalt-zinc-cadmium efflux system membrane fusion protein
MNKFLQAFGTILVLAIGAALAMQILRAPTAPLEDGHGHGGEANHDSEEIRKGSHRGRMLEDHGFSLEVSIFERGIPPEFRVYAYADGQPVAASDVDLSIQLLRLGNRTDTISFTEIADYLRGDQTIVEPHSFDVTVLAEYRGKSYRWEYESPEGRVELSPGALRTAKIEVETVGPATVRTTLTLTGKITPNEDRMAHLIPRFPGVVKQSLKRLGDRVKKGELVAVVQSNESLQSYEVRTPIDGTIIKKHVTVGEFVAEGDDIYVVADLSSVWVDLNVYRQDFSRLALGQRVILDAGEGMEKVEGSIDYISPFGAANSQTMLARMELPNPDGSWRPGLFVTGELVIEEAEVPVAVKASALQTLRDWTVVFLREGNSFEATPIETGRQDAEWVEVLSGVQAGRQYVTTNSFIVKAELGKAGATHDH